MWFAPLGVADREGRPGNAGANSDVGVPFAVLALDQLPALHADGACEEMPLVVADSKRETFTTAHGSEAHALVLHPKRERALVVGHRRAVLEAAGLLAPTLRDTPDGLYRKVRGEAELLSQVVVAQTVQRKPSPLVVLSGYLQGVVAGIGKSRNGLFQRVNLTRGRLNLRFDREHQGFGHPEPDYSRGAVKRAFLGQLKQAVSSPCFG